MKHQLHQILLLGTLIVFGCNSESTLMQQSEMAEEEIAEMDIDSLLLANSNTDTLKVSGKAIVFFSISQPEYDVYPKGSDSGIDEVLSDFEYYSHQVADSLKKSGYKLTLTASRFVRCKLDNDSIFLFDRFLNNEHIVGRLYSDGRKVSISYGVATDIDIFAEFDKFSHNRKE